MFDECLNVIERALAARRVVASQDPYEAVDVGPDHSTALTTVAYTIKMMTAGRFRPRLREPRDRIVTMDDMQELITACKDVAGYQAAEEERISRYQSAADSPDRPMLPALVDQRRERIEALFDRAVPLMQGALRARQIVVPRKPPKSATGARDFGPDYGTALTAIGLLMDILLFGRALPKAPQDVPWKRTFEELLELVKEFLKKNPHPYGPAEPGQDVS
jgi:hypothetical protein